MDNEGNPASGSEASILLVDDTPSKLLAYEIMLRGLGVRLVKADSADSGFRALLHTDIALIITDVSMPDIDGFEFARMVREHPRFARTPIIFVSAFAQSELDQLQGYETGAVDYVSVPVSTPVFRAKVKVFLDLFTQRRELEMLKGKLENRVAERTAELEASRGQLKVLVREMQHRIKNLLAVVQSLTTNTLARAANVEDASKALLGRLHALGNAQDLVAEERSGGVPLRGLADAQLAAFGAQVLIDGEPLLVGNSFAQSFALIVHELATNAVKYGSLSAQKGTVSLAWSVVFTAEGRHLKLSWTERGGPPPPTKITPGFGSTLLSMYGHAVTELTENGLEYALMVPLAEILKTNTSPTAESVAADPEAHVVVAGAP
jgi:two-component sensor histidine kinase/ActR/RegA family two-component response regulator